VKTEVAQSKRVLGESSLDILHAHVNGHMHGGALAAAARQPERKPKAPRGKAQRAPPPHFAGVVNLESDLATFGAQRSGQGGRDASSSARNEKGADIADLFRTTAVKLGFGRIVPLHHRSCTLCQIFGEIRYLYS
jgi:hypothetical protein